MIERGHANPRVVRRGNECIARSEARAHDTELVVALLFEPVEAAADIDDALAHGIERTTDIAETA